MKGPVKVIFSIIVTIVIGLETKGLGTIAELLPENFNNEQTILWTKAALAILIFIAIIACLSYIGSLVNKVRATLENKSVDEVIVGIIGLVLGLVIANLIGIAFLKYTYWGTIIVLGMNIIFGTMGYTIAQKKIGEVNLFKKAKVNRELLVKSKVLDTSVIIDGRILDILKTGFIEGKIIIPQFVLDELRHIADSSDALKRNRGRRGLDILNEIQKQLDVPVEIIDKDYKHIDEVDSKLLKLSQDMEAAVVTNDYNLNKVADFQGVVVLNINELSNAIKPIVLPGEDMTVTIIKCGKEDEQGVAYLNDGTMIVVEGGKRAIGKTIDVLVTSVLQTAAGRMIFTKMKH